MNERSSAFWEVFCRIFVENTEANNFPPHHFAHRSFEFFAGEFVEAKKSSRDGPDLLSTPWLFCTKDTLVSRTKNTTDFVKKYQFDKVHKFFLSQFFFWRVDI